MTTQALPLSRATCPHCGGAAAAGSTCPRAIACPSCGAAPDRPCRRPSGHKASSLHAARVDAAELADAEAGIVYELAVDPAYSAAGGSFRA